MDILNSRHQSFRRALFFSAFFIFSFFGLLQPKNALAATATLTPSSGVSGQEVFITGSAFDNSSTLTATWDGSALTTTPTPVTTSGAGAIPSNVSFVVPSASFGPHVVRLSTSSSNFITVTFTISTSAISVTSPVNATLVPAYTGIVPGNSVVVSGTNFEANKTTTIWFDNTSMGTITSSVAGAFDFAFTIPDVNNTGTHIIRASNSTFAAANTAVTIAAPTLTLNPATAVPGLTTTVTGTNFKAGGTVTLTVNGAAVTTSPSTITANGAGGFVASFTTPDLTAGTATVKASSYTELYATATMTVTAPTITLSPATVSPGTVVNVTGINFKAATTTSILLNGSALTLTDGTTSLTSNSQGGFTTTFTVPAVPSGSSTVKAVNYDNFFGTATLTVAATVLTVSPATGPDGLIVYASGTGFEGGKTVNFYMNGSDMGVTATSTTLGTFTTPLTIPKGIPSGIQTIRAQTNSINFANATYTVTAATLVASPTAGPPGVRVTLTGTNFDPNSDVSLKWNGATLATQEDDLKSNSAGSFVANVTIPSSFVPGANQIEASTSAVNTILLSFTVANPTLTLAPATGAPGARITVAGTNFEGNQKVVLKWDNQYIRTEPAVITTTPLGGFFAVITIPNANRGTHYVSATAGTQQLINSSAAFTITAPSLTSSVATTQSDTLVTLYGANFTPKTSLTFLWDNHKIIYPEEGETKTDSAGAFSYTIRVPKETSPGVHTLMVKANELVFATINYTITTGAITLSKTSGNPHMKVQVDGASFNANSPVTFYWDNQEIPDVTTTTDGIGGYTTYFLIPLSKPGTHTIRTSTSEFSTAQSDFTIEVPSLATLNSESQVGSTIVISGTNFVGNEEVKVFINNRQIPLLDSEKKTDEGGSFIARVKVPLTLGDSIQIQAKTGDSDLAVLDIPLKAPLWIKVLRAALIIVAFGALGLGLWEVKKHVSRQTLTRFFNQGKDRFNSVRKYLTSRLSKEKKF